MTQMRSLTALVLMLIGLATPDPRSMAEYPTPGMPQRPTASQTSPLPRRERLTASPISQVYGVSTVARPPSTCPQD